MTHLDKTIRGKEENSDFTSLKTARSSRLLQSEATSECLLQAAGTNQHGRENPFSAYRSQMTNRLLLFDTPAAGGHKCISIRKSGGRIYLVLFTFPILRGSGGENGRVRVAALLPAGTKRCCLWANRGQHRGCIVEPQRTFQQKEKPSSNLDIKVQMSSGGSL